MELGIETLIEGNIIEQGKIALDAKLFSEIVRKLPDNDVTIQTDQDFKAIITCEKPVFILLVRKEQNFLIFLRLKKNRALHYLSFH